MKVKELLQAYYFDGSLEIVSNNINTDIYKEYYKGHKKQVPEYLLDQDVKFFSSFDNGLHFITIFIKEIEK